MVIVESLGTALLFLGWGYRRTVCMVDVAVGIHRTVSFPVIYHPQEGQRAQVTEVTLVLGGTFREFQLGEHIYGLSLPGVGAQLISTPGHWRTYALCTWIATPCL